jgi:hypothetical protein
MREKLFKALIKGTTRENLFKIAEGEIKTATSFLSSVQKDVPGGRNALFMYKGNKIFIAEFWGEIPGVKGQYGLVFCISPEKRDSYKTKRENLTDKQKQWKGKQVG